MDKPIEYEISKVATTVTVKVTFPNNLVKNYTEDLEEVLPDDSLLDSAMERIREKSEKDWSTAHIVPKTKFLNLGLIKANYPNRNGEVYTSQALKDMAEKYATLATYDEVTDALYISVLVPEELLLWSY